VQDSQLTDIAHLKAPAHPAYLGVCRLALAGVAAGLPVSDDALEDLKFALSEACGNAIQHAYGDEPGTIEVIFRAGDGELEITVVDEGRGFDPRAVRDDEALGIGLSMIRALSSRWRIESGPDGRGTVVTFARRLPA
jgi:serine/threonine-protein kinase RsbW